MSYTHFAHKDAIMEAMVAGVPVVALCGASGAVEKYASDATAQDCPECLKLLDEIKKKR